MMYRVYINFKGQNFVKRYFNEEQMINELIYVANTYHTYDFDIYEVLDNQSYHYKRVFGVEDFENMLYEYNSTREVPDISCTRLKDEITRRYLHPEQYRHQ